MEPKVDGEFQFYGGKIQGKNLELVREIMKWAIKKIGRKQENQTTMEIR